MPFLVSWEAVKFSTVGEVVDFCSQVFEGLQYMHSLNIAHNDAKDTNIMMDWSPLYDSPPHFLSTGRNADLTGAPKHHNRTTRPVKYHFIDWNLSNQYNPEDGPHLLRPGYGGDRTVPEFSRNEQCDPFKVDVYCLGNLIRTKFLTGDSFSVAKGNLEFLQGLISEMTHDDPSKRPNMDQVVSRFDEIRKGLSSRKLRSRVFNKNEHFIQQCLIFPFHWLRQAAYVARRLPAIPRYTARDVRKE